MRQDRIRRRHSYERDPNGHDLYDISLSLSRPTLRQRLTGILIAALPVVFAIGAIAWFMRAYIAPPTATIEPANFTERSALIDDAIFTKSAPRRNAPVEVVRAPADPEPEQNAVPVSPSAAQSTPAASADEIAVSRPAYDVSASASAATPAPAPSDESRPSPAGSPTELSAIPPARPFGAPLALPSAVPSALASDAASGLSSTVPSAASTGVPLPRRRPRGGEVSVSSVGGAPIAIPPLPQERPASAPAPEARAAPPEPVFDRDRIF